MNLTDAVIVLRHLFLESDVGSLCMDSLDADDSGIISVNDPLVILGSVFHGMRIAAPVGACGLDRTADVLRCEGETGCP